MPLPAQKSDQSKISSSHLEFINTVTRLCQKVGLPRTFGEIYGLIYLSENPLSLDDISSMLSISKGSASIGTRKLLSLHAIRQVWAQGSRKDFFEARADLKEVIHECMERFLKPNIEKSRKKLEKINQMLDDDLRNGEISPPHHKLAKQRMKEIEKIEKKFRRALPFAERLI